MTREEYYQIIYHSIEQTMEDNYDQIGYSLLKGVDEHDDLLTLETKMLRNAIGLSCQISLQLTGDMLEQAGLLTFEEPEPEKQKPHLRILPSPQPPREGPEEEETEEEKPQE